MEIQRSDMTEKDIDMLSNMMLIFFHAGEKCLQIVEDHFVKEHRASQEYKEIKKRVGKIAADEILKTHVKDVLRHDMKFKYGEVIKRAEQLKQMMDTITLASIGASAKDIDSAEAYDLLHHDVNWLCKFYAYVTNITSESDAVKLESAVKMYAKGNMISEKIMDKFDVVL